MPTPENKKLYQDVIRYIDTIYQKPSAYRSGAIIKEYKRRGGIYIDDTNPKNLERWFKEKWTSINPIPGGYPTYRPTKRITKDTPYTVREIPKERLIEQYILKQLYKGAKNLPPFI
jgi:hypothetical protein